VVFLLSVSSTGSISLQPASGSAPTPSGKLSVSSTGSISLQQNYQKAVRLKRVDFQYPQPDRYPCNNCPLLEVCAGSLAFQYPQPDRYPCNANRRLHRTQVGKPFSILNRIDIPATINQRTLYLDYVDFQYPQPDRYPCNCTQREKMSMERLSFSILNRIDIPATKKMVHFPLIRCVSFSILNRIDIPATKRISCMSNVVIHFQYPQPDRYPCNCSNMQASQVHHRPFSILNRIDIPATEHE